MVAIRQQVGSEERGMNKIVMGNQVDGWRPRPELNWCTRFCRPLRNHSATWPHAECLRHFRRLSQVQRLRKRGWFCHTCQMFTFRVCVFSPFCFPQHTNLRSQG
jgi:hypothetical protein